MRASAPGVKLFINARTDVYLKQLVPARCRRVTETLKRAKAIKEAGASGLFVPGLADAAEIKAIAAGCGLPLNVMARPGAPKAAALQALGAKRVSAATSHFQRGDGGGERGRARVSGRRRQRKALGPARRTRRLQRAVRA